jgi:predicted Zn finger-like uncharacterized protein
MPIECPECYTWHPVAAEGQPDKVKCEGCGHIWDPLPRRAPTHQ